MRCGALLLAVQCGYVILQAVLVRFIQFGEHPYLHPLSWVFFWGQNV